MQPCFGLVSAEALYGCIERSAVTSGWLAACLWRLYEDTLCGLVQVCDTWEYDRSLHNTHADNPGNYRDISSGRCSIG